jgi:hypothetical protein
LALAKKGLEKPFLEFFHSDLFRENYMYSVVLDPFFMVLISVISSDVVILHYKKHHCQVDDAMKLMLIHS